MKAFFNLLKISLVPILYLTVVISCADSKKETKGKDGIYTFLVGTYTDKESEGIYQYALYPNGKLERIKLLAKTENPSFLAFNSDRQVLVAVNEIDNKNMGGITAFKVTADSLQFLNSSISGGAHPCHLAINDQGYILVSNYTGGNLGLLQLNDSNMLSPLLDVMHYKGKGKTSRQDGPHAHSAWYNPHDSTIIGIDLGTDQLWFLELDKVKQELRPLHPPTLSTGHGAGPRHLVFHPKNDWIYVVNELNSSISLVQRGPSGNYRVVASFPTLPEGFEGENTCADIRISGEGKYLYASNRGHNSIVIYAVDQRDGTLTLVGHELTQGDGPRNFSLSPDNRYLVVANQHSDNIVSFKRNENSGTLHLAHKIKAPTPVCILFY